jgi:hypothetical protein
MAQSPIQKTSTKEFDQRLRYIIKEHWFDIEPPNGVWKRIQYRLESQNKRKTMLTEHAFSSKAVVRVLSGTDPDDPTMAS